MRASAHVIMGHRNPQKEIEEHGRQQGASPQDVAGVFTQTTISRVEDGRIAEMWEDLDFFNFIKQLEATIKRPTPDEQA
jgi:hypothetical protein